MKIRQVGAELFHANRQTDRHDEANSRFHKFAEAPKNYKMVIRESEKEVTHEHNTLSLP
jgi:hypothetical protein